MVTLQPWVKFAFKLNNIFSCAQGRLGAESNATVRPNVEFACTPTGNRQHSQHFGYECNSKWLRVASSQRSALHGSGPLEAAGSRSQQHVRLLMGAKTVDSESKWQTDHSFHQQWSQTAAAPAPWTNTFSFTVVSSPWFPLLTSPKLTSLSLPRPPSSTDGNKKQAEVYGLYGGRVQMVINVRTPGRREWCSIDVSGSMPFISFLLRTQREVPLPLEEGWLNVSAKRALD